MFDKLTALETNSVRNYCIVEVVSVRTFTSFVQLSVASLAGTPTLATTTLTQRALKRFPVQIRIGDTLPEGAFVADDHSGTTMPIWLTSRA